MSLAVPPIQDIVRLVGSDAGSTAANYRAYLRRPPGEWGYSPAKNLAKAIFSHELSRTSSVNACGSIGHPGGRPSNAEVGGLVWDLASLRPKVICHKLEARYLRLRADFAVKVDPLFFFLSDGRPTVFYLQPRRGCVPNRYGLRVLASAISSVFMIDDLEDADLLLFDLSCPDGSKTRRAVAYTLDDLPPLPQPEVEGYFQRFVDAYDLLVSEGVERAKRRPRRPSDSVQAEMFMTESPV